MTPLLIILGIVLFFVLLLSVPVLIDFEYTDAVRLRVQWLFLKFNIYPKSDKPKKEKKKKPEKKKKEEPQEEETNAEEQKPKKENPFKTFYNNQGVGGMLGFIGDCCSALGRFNKGFLRSFYILKLRIYMSITEGDAAATAIKYGKVCSELYPSLGYICSSCHVKNYKVNIFADYIGEKTVGELETRIALVPRRTINAGIALVFRLGIQLLKVVFLNIKSANNQANSVKKGG